jgi:hypothetical protein
MKKIFLVTVLAMITTLSFAQNDKYVKTMEVKIAAFDTTRSVIGLGEIANDFERIANAEKTQWLPFYYAALANVNMGYTMLGGQMGGDASKIDPIADKAEKLINKAEELSKNNSEIYVIKKMIASLRMMVDPQARYMTYGPAAATALETAKKLNPENPRIFLLEGQDKFYTPEAYGGSKTEAKKLLEAALKKFDSHKTESNISPNWGRGTTQYFLSQIK